MSRGEGRWRESPPPRSAYHHAKWHAWWVCRVCGAVVEDWPAHDEWHEGQAAPRPADAYALELATRGAEGTGGGLREQANAEGRAVVEAGMVRGGWRQVRDVLRLHPPREA